MKSRGIFTILIIAAAGTIITVSTRYILNQSARNAETASEADHVVYEDQSEDMALSDTEDEESSEAAYDIVIVSNEQETYDEPISPLGTGSDTAGSDYLSRLTELDLQIERTREDSESSSANLSAQGLASNELRQWENELNIIYNSIRSHLDEEADAQLVEEQREWMKERDLLAGEAAMGSSGGSSDENVEYLNSMADSTRQRAYELVNRYGNILSNESSD